MINSFYCTNIFSENAAKLIAFYRDALQLPVIKTDDDENNGVYFGFLSHAPMLCVWDSAKCQTPPTGKQSFVFSTQALDTTRKAMTDKGVQTQDPIRYEWGTYEMRLSDPDGNEVVIVEFIQDQRTFNPR